MEAELKHQKRANRRALALFRRHLTPSQLKQYKARGNINVRGSSGGSYVINCKKIVGNIYNTRSGRGYCVVLQGDTGLHSIFSIFDQVLPRGDHLLAQKLIIETNEKKFRRIAWRVS